MAWFIKSLLLVVAFTAHPALATELKLFAPGALRSTLMDVLPAFEKENRYVVKIEYGAAGPLAARVRKGDAADAAVLSRAEITSLSKEGIVKAGLTPDVARVGIGIMVRKGQLKPDISSVENLKRALMNASSIGLADPAQGAAGAHLVKVFTSWGMMDELAPKIRALPPGSGLYAAIENGTAEIGFSPVSEILARQKTLDYVGPVPAAMQNYNRFAGGVLTASKQPEAAAKLIEFLASDPIADALRNMVWNQVAFALIVHRRGWGHCGRGR